MINNRQGGRRRGRGGQRGQNVGGHPGNRQDNRQRGNAAQLLEKYKSMARDAQLAGDRVQTEYYLQFADHYFRVLSESRARFEEQNPRRGRDEDDQYDDDSDDLDMDSEAGDEQLEAEDRQDRQERQDRGDRGQRRNNRPRRDRDERQARGEGGDDAPRHATGAMNGGGETIAFDVLPPAIGRDDEPGMDDEEEQPRPARRRTRRPRATEGDEEIAPAA